MAEYDHSHLVILETMLDHKKITTFLSQKIGLQHQQFRINRLLGDASNRTYYRLHLERIGRPHSMILMELAEPEAFKKSEEKVSQSTIPIKELPYINILNHLARSGIAVPKLYYYNKAAGWLFLEDLGHRTVEQEIKGKGKKTIQRYYEQALDELVKIQDQGSHQGKYRCVAFGRTFDMPLVMWEFDHFLQYGIPYCARRAIKPSDRKKIRAAFLKIADELARLPRTFTHRDYHSRNLMVHRKRIWVLDFQDALMGPYVYDLASLLRDSYTILDNTLVNKLLDYYQDRSRSSVRQKQNPESFRRIFDLMTVQRNLKAVGRFAYISQVKNNPRFLRYIPQTLRSVKRNLDQYPELSTLRTLLQPYLQEIIPA